ncbi:MAG TPA: RnfH family protein [Burkholderiales bacterium]|jgi:putative ubiquitin-RnfH superfamily antitoxin RatB of RatAB toxin-antitoxin module|nr:RnfH family protein [Burkholderiales bacterium]
MAAEALRQIRIEIVYARADEALVIELTVPAGTTVREALEMSDIASRDPEIELGPGRVGIYGRAAADDTVLREDDRIEIYRPLIADPKQARRRRAAHKP